MSAIVGPSLSGGLQEFSGRDQELEALNGARPCVTQRDSFVHLNNKPGFGAEINWDYAKRFAT